MQGLSFQPLPLYHPMDKLNDALFYCGTSNLTLPVPNKDHYPPEYKDKSRLHYYASLFNSVEVNSTFYKLPMERTVEKWASDVPPSFRFTFKMPGAITHAKELNFNPEDIQRFLHVVNRVDDKKGCLLIQFPPSIKVFFFRKFRQLLDELYKTDAVKGWQVAVEFRDKSWYQDMVYQLLETYGISVVIHDIPASSTPLIDMEAGFIYLRFHGEKGDYRGGYSRDFLEEYAAYIREWMEESKPVFVYFNNTIGDAAHNAALLKQLILFPGGLPGTD